VADFRIAGGYVEVTVRPNKDQARKAADEAAAEFEAGVTSSGRFSQAGQHAGRDFATGARTSVGHDLEDAIGASGTTAGDRFATNASGRLRDASGRFVKAGDDIGKKVGDAITGGLGSSGSSGSSSGITGLFSKLGDFAGQAGSRISDAFAGSKQALSSVADGLGSIGSAAGVAFQAFKWVGGVGTGLELLPPVLFAIGGALASLPALAVGAGMALGTLELGTQGIGAALGEVFNPRQSGGGMAQSADQMAAAERNLTVAQRDEKEAQQALNQARQQAAFDLQDLTLQLNRAHIDERSAALAVVEAQHQLMQAQATGDPLAVARSQIAYQQAVATLAEAKQHTVELTATQQDAAQKGVDNSDKVRAAEDRLQNSINAVADAQAAVRQASVSAGAAMVTAYSKLSPEAKKFVDEVRRLKPELTDLQQFVQDRLFAGLDVKLDKWAHVWIPDLRKNMGMFATDFNSLAGRLGDDLSKPEVVSAVDRISGVFDRLFNKFTGTTLDKLVTSFSALVDKASPFIEELAGGALDKIGSWADDLNNAAKDGSLENFFKEAAKDARDLWSVGEDVFGIVSDIIGTIFGQNTADNKGKNALDQLKDTMDKVKKWFDSDNGKQTLKDIVQGFDDVGGAVGAVVGWVMDCIKIFVQMHDNATSNIDAIGNGITTFKNNAVFTFQLFADAVFGVFQGILDAADNALSWVPGLGPKLDQAKRNFSGFVDSFNREMDRLDSHKDITLDIWQTNKTSGSNDFRDHHGERWGGVRYAQAGLMSLGRGTAGIYAGGPLYGFAEPDTGGELFMPRNGDPQRNKALAAVANQWAGLPAPSTGAGGAAAAAMPTSHGPYVFEVDGHTLIAFMIDAISGHPTVVSAAAEEGDRLRSFTSARTKR
jgi:hypothetical protein